MNSSPLAALLSRMARIFSVSSANSPNDFCEPIERVGLDFGAERFEPVDHFLHGEVLVHPLGDPAAAVAAELHVLLGLHVGGLHVVKRLAGRRPGRGGSP